MERIGEVAIQLLIRRVGGEASPPERHLLTPELILRESIAAPVGGNGRTGRKTAVHGIGRERRG